MSVGDIPAVRDASTQLRALLQTARQVKQTTSIEPPLAPSEFENAVRQLSQQVSSNGSNADSSKATPSTSHIFAAVETAARNIFYELLAQHDIADPSFVQVWNLLDILQICADCGQCDPSMALWLIEELLDSQTIAGCRRVFDYLESRRERLITNVYSKSKQLVVLRSCNELLRRLSRAEDAVFCGRVFIFLFQSFPLGDKSSVNLRGEFHVENTTSFDEKAPERDEMDVDNNEEEAEAEETQVAKDDEDLPTASPETNGKSEASLAGKNTAEKTGSQGKEANDETTAEALYPIFWSLQKAFSNPPSLFDEAALTAFKSGLELTLKKFKSAPKVTAAATKAHTAASSNGSAVLGKRKRDLPITSTTADLSNAFNPKYLTSFDLFALELSDLTFQRHILVQSLILIEFLLSLTPKAKARLLTLKAQKALQYPFVLSEDDEKWAKSTRNSIANYIKEGPDGHFYYRMVDNILTRDKNWVRWKVESCPPITREPLSTDAVVEARTGTAARCRVKKLRANPMGALDLKFLQPSGTPGIDMTPAELAEQRPSPDELIRQARNYDLDIEFVVPVAEDLEKREAELRAKEAEVKGRVPLALAEQRSQYREEYKAHIKERANFEAERASRTWRLLRGARRNRFAKLAQVDEAKDLSPLSEEPQAVAEAERDEEESSAALREGDATADVDITDAPADVGGADGSTAAAGEGEVDIGNEGHTVEDEPSSTLEDAPAAADIGQSS